MVPAHRVGDGAALVAAHRGARLGGRDGQAPRHAVPAGQAHAELAQGEEPAQRRGGDRRLHAGHRQPRASTFGALLVGVPAPDGLAASPAASAPASTSERSTDLMARLRERCAARPARSARCRRASTRATPPGCAPSCGRPSRSPSSPTTASSATPASPALIE